MSGTGASSATGESPVVVPSMAPVDVPTSGTSLAPSEQPKSVAIDVIARQRVARDMGIPMQLVRDDGGVERFEKYGDKLAEGSTRSTTRETR